MTRDVLAERVAHLERMARLTTPAERSEYRRRVTERDPLMFGLIYLRKHFADKAGTLSVSPMHEAWCESAKSLMVTPTTPASDRRAEVAPRESGKSTIHFLVAPMWAAAHAHVSFIAAFASAAAQAEGHLATFKRELEDNPLIRDDYPDLVAPKTRGRGTLEADRVSLYHARSGFVFAAAGMDTSSLGMKVGERRPDLLLLDDIEPHEGMYTAALAKKRLDTLQSAIFPLNIYAHVIIVGTVTMQGSIVHQIAQHANGERDEDNAWVGQEQIVARHTKPFVVDEHGERASVWPEKWPLDFLESIEHTRSFAKNYANDPMGAEGDYWTLDDIKRVARDELGKWGVTRVIVSVDPAVTTKATSDYTGIAVVGWSPTLNRCVVLEVRQVRKSGADIRLDVLATLERWADGVPAFVLVETNQGGELWADILWGMPVKVKTVHQTESKEVRAADVLDHYQRGRVYHLEGTQLRDFEGQLVAFPRAPHDDMVDAAGSGVRYFLSRNRGRNRGARGTGVGAVSVGYAA